MLKSKPGQRPLLRGPGLLFSGLLVALVCCSACQSGVGRGRYRKRRVLLPHTYTLPAVKRREHGDQRVRLTFFGRGFARGELVYLEVEPVSGTPLAGVRLVVGKRAVVLTRRPWGWRGLLALAPGLRVSRLPFVLWYRAEGSGRRLSGALAVRLRAFPEDTQAINLGAFSRRGKPLPVKTIRFIRRCLAKKRAALRRWGPDLLDEFRSHPLGSHRVTSPFWEKRRYLRYRLVRGQRQRLPDVLNIHRGLDLAGKTGDRVYALASGRVVLAERMYYEGNFIVIDHGRRVFSYYMHLHGLETAAGEEVRAGDPVGTVGSTGFSSGPHLHISLLIRGIQVDPLSLLPLPLR